MRIILDTNVFISGIFFTGPPSHILKAWRDGKVQLLGSGDRSCNHTFHKTREGDVLPKKVGPAKKRSQRAWRIACI